MSKRPSALAIACVVLLFVGSGCSSGDTDTLFSFLNDWAVAHNIVTADGKPTGQTVKYVGSGGFISTGDPTVDAATDAGDAVHGVVEADQKLDDADAAMADGTQNGRAKALELSAEAVKGRPDDPGVRSRRGIILQESGQSTEAQKYLSTYSDGCDAQAHPGMSPNEKQRCIRTILDENDSFAKSASGADRCAGVDQRVAANMRIAALQRSMGDAEAAASYETSAGNIRMSCSG